MEPISVAAVQAAPVFLDREATIARVGELTAKAAGDGAGLVVFPETFVPGYPDWVWRTKPWDKNASALFARLLDESMEVPGPETDRLGALAAANEVYLAVGVNERSRQGGTIYNAFLYFGPDGTLLFNHRKLVPTGGERLVWGSGDGSNLGVIETPFGRVGGLTCWENYMPLARAALYADGIDVYLAPTWDNSDVWVPTMRHIAREGRCFVVGINFCMRGSDVPQAIPGRDDLYHGEDDWMAKGNTVIVGPEGSILAGPLVGEEGIVTASLDATEARLARQQFDAVGHYARHDVLRLVVDREAKEPVVTPGHVDGAAATPVRE